jgi:hypothetical protein
MHDDCLNIHLSRALLPDIDSRRDGSPVEIPEAIGPTYLAFE